MPEKHFIGLGKDDEIAAIQEKAGTDRWIFVCHGFGGNKQRQSEYLELADRGFNVVAFDFRGNGESSGDFIRQDLSSRIEDLETVVDHFSPSSYALFGTSFGGKVAFQASPGLNADAVIGKAPVTYNSIMDKFRNAVENKEEFEYIDGKPIDRRFFEDFDRYSFQDVTGELEIPVAIFHGSADTTVHPENSFRAAKELEVDVTLYRLKDEKHSFSDSGKRKLFDALADWLNRELD